MKTLGMQDAGMDTVRNTFSETSPLALRGFERVAVPALSWWNRQTVGKQLAQKTINELNARWILGVMKNLLQVHHEQPVLSLDAPKGVILVANHLSFFDMYVCASWMQRHTSLVGHVYFPVRSDYFYTRPDGMLLNMAISGGSMWPPVFRDGERRGLNEQGVQELVQRFSPGAIVGFHPEGRRNQGDDPHVQAPCRPGVGKVILQCDPDVVVLPYFIIGLSNRFADEITRGSRRAGQRGQAVRLWFGEPLRAGELQRLGDARTITDRVMACVAERAQQDRDAGTPAC